MRFDHRMAGYIQDRVTGIQLDWLPEKEGI